MRPFVLRLANRLGLCGWIANQTGGVVIEIQGAEPDITTFVTLLRDEAPPLAQIDKLHSRPVNPDTECSFSILPSLEQGPQPLLSVPTDRAPCASCLQEIREPGNRRFGYAFTSCTDCGPRWSILSSLPFDRANTTLANFPLCLQCQHEYRDPQARRCHAQTLSCPRCGPRLQFTDNNGEPVAEAGSEPLQGKNAALSAAVEALRAGRIIALKSVGGFQLLVDANNASAIERLRQRKRRPAKPLAVMFASLQQAECCCWIDPSERAALSDSSRPIVLLRCRHRLPDSIAPGCANLGAMLPPSALHYLLMDQFNGPLVATSGNLSGEPLCYRNHDALRQLGGIADAFLLHNLDIAQPLDDSVIRLINKRQVSLRAGRGLAPYLVKLGQPESAAKPVPRLALGGHQKSSVALSLPEGMLCSQHLGDLDSLGSQQHFAATIDRMQQLFGHQHSHLLRDLHPHYGSSHWAETQTVPALPVQHHVAHFFSAMAEHQYAGPALGVCWDGSGLGDEDSLWGSEFFYWDGQRRFKRVAHLRPFPLPGGEQAIREPRRQALALLYLMHGEQARPPACLQAVFTQREWCNLQTMLARKINSPLCSSVGRLIDAVAALLQVCAYNRYEAEAAMALEALAGTVPVEQRLTSRRSAAKDGHLPYSIDHSGPTRIIDWQPMIAALLQRAQAGQPKAELAAAFHHTLADIIVSVSQQLDRSLPELPIFLSGGVFQNKLLTEAAVQRLQAQQRQVYCHARVPPNDAGLALGQLYYAHLLQLEGSKNRGTDPSCA